MTDEQILAAARTADRLGIAIGAVFDDGTTRPIMIGDTKSRMRQLVALADNGEHLVLCDAPSPDLVQDVFDLPNVHMNATRYETRRLVNEGISKNLGASMHRQALVSRSPDPMTRERIAEALAVELGKTMPRRHVVGVDVAKGDSDRTVKATITIQDPKPAEYVEIKFATPDTEDNRRIAEELGAVWVGEDD